MKSIHLTLYLPGYCRSLNNVNINYGDHRKDIYDIERNTLFWYKLYETIYRFIYGLKFLCSTITP